MGALTAAVLSFIIPGLGQFYNGQVKKAIVLFILAIIFRALSMYLIGIPFYIIVWFYGIYDAYKTAQRKISGEIPVSEKPPQQQEQQMQQQVVIEDKDEARSRRKRICINCGIANEYKNKHCSECGYDFPNRSIRIRVILLSAKNVAQKSLRNQSIAQSVAINRN